MYQPQLLNMKGFIVLLILAAFQQISFCQGCSKGNCITGFGTYHYSNGGRYTGEFKAGRKDGKGIYYYANENKYLGEWKNDFRTGEGKLNFRNGDVYTGSFRLDKMEGQGMMDFASKDRYTGSWKNNKPNGKGSYYFSTGERYEGEFLDARFHGEGTLYYKNGSTYKGHWKQSKKDGYGEFKDIRGKIVAAQWSQDKLIKTLDETLATKNEEEHNKSLTENQISTESKDSIFQNEEPTTNPTEQKPTVNEHTVVETKKEEVLTNPEKLIICTPDEINLPNCNTTHCASGKGVFTYRDGSKFIGEFKDGQPKGKGICYYANGDRYEGIWEHHAPHGEGTMYFASGLTYGAIWDNGKSKKELFRKKEFVFDTSIHVDSNPEVKIWAVIVGIARYEHMPSLKYSDDDAYKIYAFLKSPEGGALKDEQIRILIDEDATRNNILQGMNQIFMKADENDVIMMYYSGHGLEGTFIPIDYDGKSNILQHEDVKEILNRSKAKHKVCYVDACYSGSLLAAKGPFSNSLLYFYDELEKTAGGTAFLMSSKNKEFSLEDGGLRQGVFSHFLIKGLKGEADLNKNKTVSIKELFNYVYFNVRQYTGNVQSPMIAGNYNENMPVGFIRED